ncbi:hypothetical protein K3556_15990 (plasmid) [Aliiroseovarius sp. M344]|uniref:hypothetical protein n=1 Tax=Aliiroseovarius sp. M344 TaxID=2867010 RepID=UPI0021ADBB48|nr:hypothetical protein [Aliiroseovarius sp. M344]UWQ16081.1 hypothetical protein K3556_15990 [Aliiroseovarius sp. M344]
MFKSFNQKHKVILLRSSWKRGLRQFVRQAVLVLLDSTVRKKHMAFKLGADALRELPSLTDGSILTHGTKWDAFPQRLQKQIMQLDETVEWGDLSWFDKGWRLCVGEIEGRVVCIGWMRNAENSQDFFIKLPDKTELLWHLIVIPEFRGQRLHQRFWLMLMHDRAKDGVESFFTNCRDYNLPSFYNIQKLGFKLIGHRIDNKLTGKSRWTPI